MRPADRRSTTTRGGVCPLCVAGGPLNPTLTGFPVLQGPNSGDVLPSRARIRLPYRRLIGRSGKEAVCLSFHGGGCQETLSRRPVRCCVRRRPPRSAVLRVERRCLVSVPGVGVLPQDRSAILLLIRRRVPGLVRQLRRLSGRSVLRAQAGTILPSGPRRAIASIGPVEGHILSVGTPPWTGATRTNTDAHLRPRLASSWDADHLPGLPDGSAHRRGV